MDQDIKEGWVQVGIQAFQPLIMKDSVQFKAGGAEAPIEFDYEYLEKHCFVCFALTHEEKDCPKISKDKQATLPSLGINQQKTISRLEEDKRRRGTLRPTHQEQLGGKELGYYRTKRSRSRSP
ncbi:unnamed protein product [Arabis nemorensis]|uniref:Zinc knuckle CX2CX4HX4C domain-containing protein n=1 Tax=Arabis nemorensis TaxID=586526 RepID=A0A565BIU9_9BRAS|nr:unnamed protein product [Arabis nemorensis]